MSLDNMLSTVRERDRRQVDTSEENVLKHMDKMRDLIAYWRAYPDRFVDYLCSLNPKNSFKFFFYQRFYLRVIFRHRYVYATFTRGFSKSFMAVLGLMIEAILYPGSKLFMVSDVKNQSAEILSSKVRELVRLIPALEREIEWDTRGKNCKTIITKDKVSYQFKNGSVVENLAAAESSRGQRYNSGIIEECAKIDGKILNSVVIPTMAVDRNINGQVDKNEKLNRRQLYITSAGYKATFAYEKLIQLYCQMAVNPKEAFVFGGDYRLSLIEGRLNKDEMVTNQADATFDDTTFAMEYGSVWSGVASGSFFDPETFEKWRTIERPDLKYDNRTKDGYYIMGVDVARDGGCNTEVVVLKIVPAVNSRIPKKHVVNIFSYEAEHFEMQAIHLKRIFNRYQCKGCVVDGNGIGAGLVDFLVLDQIDPDTGETLCNWGVLNKYDDDMEKFTKFETDNTIYGAMYIMKANRNLNSSLYAYVQAQLLSGKIRLPYPRQQAENLLMSSTKGRAMTKLQREEWLMPFVQTDNLKQQMLNLVVKEDVIGLVVLKQSNSRILKDKFSALIYALYWCKMDEDRIGSRKSNLGKFVFFS
jgi:hypothetical protein